MPSRRVPRARRALPWALPALAAVLGCDDAVAPRPAFDLADRWVGTFVGARSGFAVQMELQVPSPGLLAGSAVAQERTYEVTGRYSAPVVYLRLASAIDTLAYVGEMEVQNLIDGTLLVERPGDAEQGPLILARR